MQNVNLSSIYLSCHKTFYELFSSSSLPHRLNDPFRTDSYMYFRGNIGINSYTTLSRSIIIIIVVIRGEKRRRGKILWQKHKIDMTFLLKEAGRIRELLKRHEILHKNPFHVS
jgi:hypothetical protein